MVKRRTFPAFYWPAIACMWSPHVGGGTPRNFGPCGDVLDQNRTLLLRHFECRYPYLLPVILAAEECPLVPFHVHGKAVGTSVTSEKWFSPLRSRARVA